MRLSLALALAASLAASLGPPTPAARAEVVKIGFEENGFPPFYFREGAGRDGIYQGLLKGVAKVSGDDYQLIYLPQKRKLRAFAEGEIDVEPGVNPEWRQAWSEISLYSEPFGTSDDVLIKAPADKRPIAGVADLGGRTLGCFVGFTYPKLDALFASGAVRRDDSLDEESLIRKLVKGRVDAGIIEKTVAAYFLKIHPDLPFTFGGVIDTRPVMFRFHLRRRAALTRFDQGLKKLIADGTLAQVFAAFR